jgi:hypothetical protein
LAAQRSNFDQTAKELNVKVAPLIAGYGIQWNIRYQSYQKAINACKVIDQIIKQDQDPNGAGNFANVLFSPRDCKEIDNLNAKLEVSQFSCLFSSHSTDCLCCVFLQVFVNLTS